MQDSNQSFFEKANQWIQNSVSIRLITIGVLILILLLPVVMVQDLIHERRNRQLEAVGEVSDKWGNQQMLTGPILTIPYDTYTKVYDKNEATSYKLVKARNYAHFLPDRLSIQGEIIPKELHRGIYQVAVYRAGINLKGSFSQINFEDWNINGDIAWSDAFISLGLSDLRSIQENVAISWGDTSIAFNPGVETDDVVESGISTKVPLDVENLDNQYTFSLDLYFNGSTSLYFVPVGKETKVSLESQWRNPKFEGAFLPTKRQLEQESFKADWKVLHLNRPYPQRFTGQANNLSLSNFGVVLLIAVDHYTKSMRSAKYAILFISLTFMVFFFVHILNKIAIHPIQYILVGMALCIFYTLLISLSEHINFNVAYLIAALAIIMLVTGYARSMFHSSSITKLIGIILIMLYAFIYIIIQLESYALLIGSIGLFLVLGLVMYLSRNIDWYNLKNR